MNVPAKASFHLQDLFFQKIVCFHFSTFLWNASLEKDALI